MSAVIRTLLAGVALSGANVVAFAANGDLDPTFGTGGFRIAGILDGVANIPAGLAVQADGRILICEAENDGTNADFFIARFTADGNVDNSFSFDGHTTIDFDGNNDACTGLAVQADGKIVVSGTTTPTGGNTDFAVARLNSDGTLDTTGFGAGSGKSVVAFDLGGTNIDQANGLALRPDGRIVVAGSATTAANGTDFAIVQLNTDGSRDTTFNLTGRVTVGFDFADSTTKDDLGVRVAIDQQGRIVIAGSADRGDTTIGSDMAVIRVLPNGQLDPDFNADGRSTLAFDLGGASGSNSDVAYGMTFDREGRIILSGAADSSPNATPNQDVAIARLLPDGSSDATFGIGGKTTIAFDLVSNGADFGLSVIEQSNGKLLVAGTSFGPAATYELGTAVRVNANGTPDTGFGVVGKKVYDFAQSSPSGQLFSGVAMQGANVVFGGALNSVDTSHIDMVVARILDDLIFADGFQ